MKNNIILVLIITLALLVRVIGISNYPTGFTQDEAGLGYEAYSILQTGKDSWGVTMPLVLRSFGDFKMPIYSYLAIPGIAIFGLNEFAVRLPGALFGTLAVLATYLMVLKLCKKRLVAIISAFVLALSPWHISLSRGAFEANLTTFFIPLGIWAFYVGLKKPRWMILSTLAFGLNLFSYHSARIFTLLIFPVLIIATFKGTALQGMKISFSRYSISIIVILTFIALLVYSMFLGAGKRGLDLTILNPTDKWQVVSDRRYEAVLQNLPDNIARIFSNKGTYLIYQFTNNYLTYLSPASFFTQGVSGWDYGMTPGRGVLYLSELISVFAGFYFFIRGKNIKGTNIFFIWFFLSPIATALSKGGGFVGTRAAVMMPSIQIISALGIYLIYKKLKFNVNNYKITYFLLIFIIFIASFTFFIENYLYHAPAKAAASMQYGRKQMIEYINQVEGEYDEIFISRTVSAPNIWVQFYKKINPKAVQLASKEWLQYEHSGFGYLDQLDGYRLGKYTFGSIDRNSLKEKGKVLVVGKPEEFGENFKPLEVILYPDNKPAFYIADARDF